MILNKLDKLFKADGKTPEQKKMQKDIAKYVFKLTSLAIRGKLSNNDIDVLQKKYDNYFNKFPNVDSEESSKDKIAKLRAFVKKR